MKITKKKWLNNLIPFRIQFFQHIDALYFTKNLQLSLIELNLT